MHTFTPQCLQSKQRIIAPLANECSSADGCIRENTDCTNSVVAWAALKPKNLDVFGESSERALMHPVVLGLGGRLHEKDGMVDERQECLVTKKEGLKGSILPLNPPFKQGVVLLSL